MLKSASTARGVFWFILSLVFCNGGDILVKLISTDISSFQVAFFRFFFSFLILIPFVIVKRYRVSATCHLKVHMLRSLILVMATTFWISGVPHVDLTIATLIGLSVPLFILPVSYIWLKETISLDRILLTILGLLSIIFALQPRSLNLDYGCLSLLIAVISYGVLDVMNKRYAQQDSLLNILFYSSLFSTLLSLPSAILVWEPICVKDIILLIVLGLSANLILFSLIKAYQRLEVSFLAPFHYLEFPQSVLMGNLIFGEVVQMSTLLGATVNLCLSIYLTYQELFGIWFFRITRNLSDKMLNLNIKKNN